MSGPRALLADLTAWATGTPWCDWLELAGSMARGADDEASDIDAGLGVEPADDGQDAGAGLAARRDAVLAAVLGLAPVADSLVQPFGPRADHLVVQYADGRQLSLVVMPSEDRPGLPPGSRAVLDRSGRLSREHRPATWSATPEQLREHAFLAWWAVRDARKHAARGSGWRAVEALHEARTHAWVLLAERSGLAFPTHGVVGVQNAGVPVPTGWEATLPAGTEPVELDRAARAAAEVLGPLTASRGVDGLAALVRSELGAG